MNRLMNSFKWFRVIPFSLVALMGLISMLFTYSPSVLLKGYYPLHYEKEIADSSSRHSVDPYLIAAVISCESSWDNQAKSSTGAFGLMQLMPQTAADVASMGLVDTSKYPLDDLKNPATNIEYGCAYLRYLLDYFSGNTNRAIAAYNAGMGNVDVWVGQGGVLHNSITYPETQAYLVLVNNAHVRYQELYGDRF